MIRVARGGLLTTVQDTGRRGVQHHGMIAAGAMDSAAHRIVNVLVGNSSDAATLECTMIGPILEFADDALLAIGGADLSATLDDRSVPRWRPFAARRGSTLVMGGPRSLCRAYIAVAGGFDVARVLGSRSTDLIAGIGGLDGRSLRPDDTLPVGEPSAAAERIRSAIDAAPGAARSAGRSLMPGYVKEPVVRIIRGPEHDRFSKTSRERLLDTAFEVTTQSNRMGIRLTGAALALTGQYDLFSSPVTAGTVQVPPSGEPIVLMADHQTIGGYPRIASVISVDLPLLAQAPPGARVRFREVDIAEAQSLYVARERDLRIFGESLDFHYS